MESIQQRHHYIVEIYELMASYNINPNGRLEDQAALTRINEAIQYLLATADVAKDKKEELVQSYMGELQACLSRE